MTFQLAEMDTQAKIKIFGVGGGGNNAINTMVESGLAGVDFIAGNTDLQALDSSKADVRIQLGPQKTKGLGAGANPEVGRESAEESIAEIKAALEGSDMVFITAGLGGGTGTGAAPVVARVSRELGALTVGVVTRPFLFEGKKRQKNADAGWEKLREHVDTIITIPNDRLLAMTQKNTTFIESMKMADDVLVQAVKGITDLINLRGYINPDFADVRAVMNEMGPALMGAGQGVGENRAVEAVNMAVASPLLQDISIAGARGVLVNISAREDSLTLAEVNEATSLIHEEADDNANIILGVIFDDSLGESMRVTVIATGIQTEEEVEELPANVKPLPVRPEPVPEAESAADENRGRDEGFGLQGRGVMGAAGRGPGKRPRFVDEEKLNIPTFLRRSAD